MHAPTASHGLEAPASNRWCVGQSQCACHQRLRMPWRHCDDHDCSRAARRVLRARDRSLSRRKSNRYLPPANTRGSDNDGSSPSCKGHPERRKPVNATKARRRFRRCLR